MCCGECPEIFGIATFQNCQEWLLLHSLFIAIISYMNFSVTFNFIEPSSFTRAFIVVSLSINALLLA